jgi:hypothetical protein
MHRKSISLVVLPITSLAFQPEGGSSLLAVDCDSWRVYHFLVHS